MICIVLLAWTSSACDYTAKKNTDQSEQPSRFSRLKGSFNADSAYRYIAEQVSFGPRVPGSEGHKQCGDYIIRKLNDFYADSVIVQEATVTTFNGKTLPIRNILGRYNPDSDHRILLAAHWDTRPWADNEHDLELRNKPIAGANDGASGVGVLLEIARNLYLEAPDCGVDILFTDAEDYGNSNGFGNNDDTWCLGTQYWVKHMPYGASDKPRYGILLDMVGGRNARFHYEMFSRENAPSPTFRVWSEARNLGYDDRFINEVGGMITDDHVYLTRAGIPTTDIIENKNEQTLSFPPTWHTHQDDMKNIDKSSLEAVGRTVLNVVYNEKPKK